MREQGRSMVEMLGVLAIVGVLSVGAIAGYSKAMMKYKLNKQAEQFSTFIRNVNLVCQTIDCKSLPYRPEPTLRKMGYMPEGLKSSALGAVDIFKHICHIAHQAFRREVGINLPDLTLEQCINLIEYAALPNANTVDVGVSNITWRYSNRNCNNINRLCLRDVMREDIYILCEENIVSNKKDLSFRTFY